MRFIDKNNPTNRIEGLSINRKILNNCWDGKKYVNLDYHSVDKVELYEHLKNEQNGLCCYCMRRIRTQDDKEKRHLKNITLEHVIPHKIKGDEWNRDKELYRKIPQLNNKNLEVCIEGNITDPYKKFGMPPFPHFLAYDNLVASCDGQTLDESGSLVSHHCCNNKRGNNYVEPLYFHQDVSTEITYDSRGHIQCAEKYVPYLQEKTGVNIMSPFLNDVRLFWKKVADSEYTTEDIFKAENDEELRCDIIDDIFTYDPTGHWFFLKKQRSWCIYSEYDWFYDYYSQKKP